MTQKKIPSFLKFTFAMFLAIMIPIYWMKYGPMNFLWFSDVTLFLAFFATIFEKKLFASMAAVGGLILETFWNVNYFLQLFFGFRLSPLTDYMFDAHLPLWLRGISLFHVALPPLVIWLILRLGYEKKAWPLQTLLGWSVLAVTWLVTDPAKDINWVYSYKKIKFISLEPLPYLLIEGAVIAVAFALTHSFLKKLTRKQVARAH